MVLKLEDESVLELLPPQTDAVRNQGSFQLPVLLFLMLCCCSQDLLLHSHKVGAGFHVLLNDSAQGRGRKGVLYLPSLQKENALQKYHPALAPHPPLSSYPHSTSIHENWICPAAKEV